MKLAFRCLLAPAARLFLFSTVALALLALAPQPASAAGIDETSLDKTVRPGDDFFSFCNGAWVRRTEIPADRGSWNTFALITEGNYPRTRALLEAAAADRSHATPAGRLAADCYTAFMDEAGIEARGLTPVQPRLQAIAAIADKAALARALGASLRADVDMLNATKLFTENIFGLWVAPGFGDSEHYVPYLVQGGLGMPDRSYYLNPSARMTDIRAKYLAHIATVLRLAGFTTPDTRAAAILALETKLAAFHAAPAETFDVLKANNPWETADFAAKAPGLDWQEFFAGTGLTTTHFVVWHPRAVTGVATLVASEPLEVWRDYLAFHTVNQFSEYLPHALADARFAFYGTVLSGTPEPAARWKRALSAADAAVPDAVGQVYVAKYFPPESKVRVQTMVANIKQAFSHRIDRLAWMSPATKAEAKAKLVSLYVGIGYPEHWTDYTGLAIDPADAAGNQIRAIDFHYRQNAAKLGGPVDKTEWCMPAQLVNAVNLPLQNALNFPAAILQAPFFDPAASDAYNYGSIGTVIGHEISHSFDDEGSQFDSQGRLRNWWTPADEEHFKAATARLAAQYSTYKPFPDLAVNGQQTLSECLADLAGIAVAFDGLKAGTAGPDQTVANGYSRDQTFFLAFGQVWRSKAREATLRKQVITDGHPPGQYRALTVRNVDAWYDLFDVQPGQALYLAPADRVRVW